MDRHGAFGGSKLSVTWGREHFSPVQYQGFDIGPFELSVVVGEDETLAAAYARCRGALDELAKQEFEQKIGDHLDRIRASAKVVQTKARG